MWLFEVAALVTVKKRATHRTAQLFTLAQFPAWGSSKGAGREPPEPQK